MENIGQFTIGVRIEEERKDSKWKEDRKKEKKVRSRKDSKNLKR